MDVLDLYVTREETEDAILDGTATSPEGEEDTRPANEDDGAGNGQ